MGEGSETGGRFLIWRARMAASLLSSVQYGLSALGLGTGQPSIMASGSSGCYGPELDFGNRLHTGMPLLAVGGFQLH